MTAPPSEGGSGFVYFAFQAKVAIVHLATMVGSAPLHVLTQALLMHRGFNNVHAGAFRGDVVIPLTTHSAQVPHTAT
jgi:hypothetical protein